MFGRNPVTHQFLREDGTLLVHSVFPTLQGEGPDVGRPAIFIRLAKCNLRCWFCDTDFESGLESSVPELINMVIQLGNVSKGNLVVITGGEPLLQNIVPFVRACNDLGLEVSVETAGTVYVPHLATVFSRDRRIAGNLIVCSPKTPKLDVDLVPLIGAFKYIVQHEKVAEDGLPNTSTQMNGEPSRLFRPDNPNLIYVQPCDEADPRLNAQNLAQAVNSAMTHGYRLSIQCHKIANLP